MFIDSNDWKANDLATKYGEDIFGLTDQKQDEVNEEILPQIIDKIKALL